MKEKELVMRAEAGDAARRACQVAEGRVESLESRLQQCTRERDELRQRVEDLQKAQGGFGREAACCGSDEQGYCRLDEHGCKGHTMQSLLMKILLRSGLTRYLPLQACAIAGAQTHARLSLLNPIQDVRRR